MKRLMSNRRGVRPVGCYVQLQLHLLEDRTVPNTYTVSSGGDSAIVKGTLRQAIAAANNNVGADTIVFTGKGATGTITLTQGELSITDSVTITGPGTLTISGGDSSRVFNINGAAFLTVSMSDLSIVNGNATGRGGGIWNQGELLTLTNCTLSNNTASTAGGGVSSVDGTLILNGCTVTGNKAGNNGGGIDGNTDVNVTIRDTTVAGNSATGSGGGVGLGSSSIFIERSTFSGNSASSGGGLYIVGALGGAGANIRQSTFSGNAASAAGGAIRLSSITSSLTIYSSTLVGNHLGGIRDSGNGSLVIESSIIAQNSSYDVYNSSLAATLKYSAVGSLSGFTYTDQGGNITSGIDLKLGPLANNGGPTQTHMLLTGSPCIDVGSNPTAATSDQRSTGYPRDLGYDFDMGATEYLPSVVTNTNNSGLGSLRQTLLDAQQVAGASTVTFDPAVFASAQTIKLLTPITIADALTIQGPGPAFAIISGNNASRVFEINGPGVLVVNISGLTITAGKTTAGAFGAGIYNYAENLTLTDCIVSNNEADGAGGGLASYGGGTLTVDHCTISGNQSLNYNGGGIDGNAGGTITIRDSTIADNIAKSRGGAFSGASTVFSIERCTISGNSANTIGGIDLNSAGPLTIRNSTVSNNTSVTGYGAGLSCATVNAQNCTITNNKAAANGGGIYGSSVTLESSIVQGNTALNGPDIYCTGTVTSKTSAIGVLDGITTFANNGGNLIGKNILLGPLADNGGPTKTHVLLAGSPCIDAGSNPVALIHDQRGAGFPRLINGKADIGAIEFGNLVVMNTNDSGFGSLRQAVMDANGSPGPDTVTFDLNVFSSSQTITLTSGEILMTDSVTIQGPGSELATVSGNNTYRVFNATGAGVLDVYLYGLTITNGKATGGAPWGGGVFSDDDHLMLSNCVVANNNADSYGGGIAIIGNGNKSATLLVDHAIIIGNQSNFGGGIYGNCSVITIRDSTIANNHAGNAGGAMHCRSDQMLIERSTISGDTALNYGAFVLLSYYAPSALLTIRNSTISTNSATNNVGGVGSVLPILMQNSTVTGNMALNNVGGLYTQSNITLESSIVQGNSGKYGPDILAYGTVSAKNSALGSIDGITTYVNNGGNLLGQDIKLGPLADNGGPTKTHALLPGSAAIDKGSNPMSLTTDQRGGVFARDSVSGKPDIGAYEFQPGAKVLSVQVNDGSPQRSRVTSLTVTFDSAVTLPANLADAFQLKRQLDDSLVGVTASVMGNAVKLNFTGSPIESGSLADGRYTLTILESQVNGGLFDGDSDGGAGDNYNLLGNPTNGLFRLYGDADGNGAVTASDFNAFRTVYGTSGASFFDFDDNSTITAADFNQFRQRYGVVI